MGMDYIAKKTILILGILVTVLFAGNIHAVLTPFLLAAMLAYLASPLVGYLERKVRLPHMAAVVLVYILFVGIILFVFYSAAVRIAQEQQDFMRELPSFRRIIRSESMGVPQILKPIVEELVVSFDAGTLLSPQRVWPYFSGALNGLESLFVFLVAAFYFMLEGQIFLRGAIGFFLGIEKGRSDVISREMNTVLNRYFRGQVFLIVLMTAVSLVALTVLRVKYAFLIALFTGVAEIVPLIGPLAATIVAAAAAAFDNMNVFGLTPVWEASVVVVIYIILRQLEDQIAIPAVIGHAIKMHPLMVLFLVLVGGHLWGVFGMILAVPLFAVGKILIRNTYSK